MKEHNLNISFIWAFLAFMFVNLGVLSIQGFSQESATENIFTDLRTASDRVLFSPDGKYLLSFGWGVRIFEFNNGNARELKRVIIEHKYVEDMFFSSCGKHLILRLNDGTVRLYSFADGNLEFEQLLSDVKYSAYSDNGRFLAITYDNKNSVNIYSVTDSGLAHFNDLKDVDIEVDSIAFSPDGKYLSVMSRQKAGFRLYRLTDNRYESLQSIDTLKQIREIKFSPDSRYLLVLANNGKNVFVYSLSADTLALLKIINNEDLRAIAFSPDSKYFVAGNRSAFCVYSVTSGIKKIAGESNIFVDEIQFSPDGNFLIINGRKHIPYFLQDLAIKEKFIRFGAEIYSFSDSNIKFMRRIEGFNTDIKFSPDSKFCVIAKPQSAIEIYSVHKKEMKHVTTLYDYLRAELVSISPDGKYLALANNIPDSYRMLQFISISGSRAEIVKTVKDEIYSNEQIRKLVFSPDGKYLAISYFRIELNHFLPMLPPKDRVRYNLKLYLVDNGEFKLAASIKKPDAPESFNMIFFPYGNDFITAPGDKTIVFHRLFDDSVILNQGSFVPNTGNTYLKFSPDGKYLLAGDKKIGLYRIYNFGFKKIPVLIKTFPESKFVFSHDSKYLALLKKKTAEIYTLSGRKILLDTILNDFRDKINNALFSPYGRFFVVSGDRTHIYKQSEGKFEMIKTIQRKSLDMKFSSDNKFLFLVSDKLYIYRKNADSFELFETMPFGVIPGSLIYFSPNDFLIVNTPDGLIIYKIPKE